MSSQESPQRVALISGVTGFIGGRLAHYLAGQGWRVCGLVRASSAPTAWIQANVTLHAVDDTYDSIRQAVAAAAPSVIFHLAADRTLDVRTGTQALQLIDANVRFGVALLEAAGTVATRAFVTAGTYWQGAASTEPTPNSLYAATKEAFEGLLRFYGGKLGIDWLALKLGDVYGQGDTRRKVFTLLTEAAQTRQPLDMSPGEQMLPFVHIDDVVRAFALAGEMVLGASRVSASYSVAGAPIRLKDAVETFQRVTGQKVDVRWGARPYQTGQIMRPHLAARLPSWEPTVTLEEGMRRLI